MSKIWKSRLAMKCLCPAYEPDKPDQCKMEICKAEHEQLRLDHTMKMLDNGWLSMKSEMSIENDVVRGRIDTVFENIDGLVTADECVSSYVPKMYKLIDAAISAGFLRHELDIPALARVVSRRGVTLVPDALVEHIWSMIMSKPFLRILSLNGDELLTYANPASGICTYCANEKCQYVQERR